MDIQSSWHKAWRDTEQCRRTTSFILVERVVIPIIVFCGGLIGFLLTLTLQNATLFQKFLYPSVGVVLGSIAGLIIVYMGTYSWNLFRAPYRQRNQLFDQINQLERDISEMQIGKPTTEKEALIQGFEKTNQGIEQISKQIEKLSNPQSNEVIIEENAKGITKTAKGQFAYIVPMENASSTNLDHIYNGSPQTFSGLNLSADSPEVFTIPDLGYVMIKFNLLGKDTFEVILMTYIEKTSHKPFSFTLTLGSKVNVTQTIPAFTPPGFFKEKSKSFILNEKDLGNISPTIVIQKQTIENGNKN